MNRFIFAVYGSLRRDLGFYNELHDPRYIRTTVLRHYKMYSLGAYPIVTHGKRTDTIVVDIIGVTLNDYNLINRIESGAGYILEYTKHQLKHNNNLPIWIAAYPKRLKGYKEIESGDWVKHKSLNISSEGVGSFIS